MKSDWKVRELARSWRKELSVLKDVEENYCGRGLRNREVVRGEMVPRF